MANGIKAQIVAPDVGQADCFLIQLYQDAQVFNLLIDGGSRYDLNWSLIDFLGMHHVTHLDVMILTHMHQDHIGQIDRIAAQFTVSAAVFPYPASQLMPPYPAVFEQERRDDTGTCIRAQAILKEQHTKLYFTFGNPRPTVFIFGKYKLECLFPTGNESSVLELLGEMRDSTADKQKEQYQQLCSNLNGDSSIWLLTYAGDDLALFCGDCLAQHLDKVLL